MDQRSSKQSCYIEAVGANPNTDAGQLVPEDQIGVRDYRSIGAAALDREAYAAHASHYSNELADRGFTDQADEYAWVSSEHRALVSAELTTIRTQVRDLNPHSRDVLNRYLATFHISRRGERLPLSSETIAASEGEHADSLLLRFLHEHDKRMNAMHQSERWQKAVFEDKMLYLDAQEELIEAGWISPHARNSQQEVLDTRVVIGDVWDTLIHDLEGFRLAGHDFVVIAQGTADNLRQSEKEIIARLRRTGSHEFDHVQFPGSGWQPTWFIEALAEHLSASRDRGIDVLDPHDRAEAGLMERNRLIDHRQLLQLLLLGRHNEVPLKLATLAHTSAGPGSPEWERFNDALDRSWGTRHVLAKVSRMVDMAEALLYEEAQSDESDEDESQSKRDPKMPLEHKVSFESQSVQEAIGNLRVSSKILYDDAYWESVGLHYNTPMSAAA